MPELPDIVVYLDALGREIVNKRLEQIVVRGVSVLKTFDPPIETCEGLTIRAVRRMGKRIVLEFEDDLFLVFHLMIAGRLFWKAKDIKATRDALAVLRFDDGALLYREVAKKKRARLWLHRGESSLQAVHARDGAEPLEIGVDQFQEIITCENRTLKRALTDPQKFSGIGNAYSDEILFRAQLSPVQRTGNLAPDEIERLFHAVVSTLTEWTERLRQQNADQWPKKVTAFRKEMNVHGKYRQACSICGAEVQRIVYAVNEVNYCPGCQTGGKVLADRAMSRFLKDDWPKTLEELEGFRAGIRPVYK